MKIKEFGVEMWMNLYENHCKYNLAETCVESLTVDGLLEMTGARDAFLKDLLTMKLTYGAIEGSERLRLSIAKLYLHQKIENILVTHGAIGANALVYKTLVEPGDHVVSVLPTYQQHYSIPESFGANVSILKLREENGFLPDLTELKQIITPKTKLVSINNPNNPTGSLMDQPFLEQVVNIARSVGAYILSDEVYRGINQEGDNFTASIADIYEKGISTGSMSKSYSLAGLRLGWIAAPKDIIHAVMIHRDYDTISVGMINDYLAALALEHKDKILARSLYIVRHNLAILDNWVAKEQRVSYIKPKGGTTALLKINVNMPSRDFCIKLLESKGVMFTPGSALDVEGYVRIGYANNPRILEDGLAQVSEFLKELD